MKQVKQFLVQEILSTDIENRTHYWHWQVELEDGQIEDDYFHCPFGADAAQQWMNQRHARNEYKEAMRRWNNDQEARR